MVQGIEHAALVSPDPEKLAAWYVEHLGFTINYHSASSKTTFVKAPNGSMLEIITSNGDPQPAHQLRDSGLRHLALAVTDFDQVYAGLKAKGVHFISEPVNNKGNRVVFFTDPEGNFLHLIQREKPLP